MSVDAVPHVDGVSGYVIEWAVYKAHDVALEVVTKLESYAALRPTLLKADGETFFVTSRDGEP